MSLCAAAQAFAALLCVMEVERSQASLEHWHMESCNMEGGGALM